MKQLEFFKRVQKLESETIIYRKPSPDHILFAENALEIFSPVMEGFRLIRHRIEVETYQTTIIFRKYNQYIKIDGSTYPRDLNNFYNIILGEGDSEEFWEWDWNSIALWRLKQSIEPAETDKEYAFPSGEKMKDSLTNAKTELLKYGLSFLNGDLTLFYETRKAQNKDREPYKIHFPDKNGIYQTIDEPGSVELKKKYS